MVALIKSKIPEELNLKLEETRDDDWTVEKLRKSVSKLILARERSEQSPDDVSHYEYTGEGLLGKEVKVRCIFCEKNHWSDECQMFKTLEQRRSRIRGRCFICLSDKHLFRNCNSDKACFHCRRKGNHHSSLCPNKFSEAEDLKNESGIKADETDLFSEDVVTINVDAEVIMKTATARIENRTNGKKGLANALLDTGAKRTYITMEKARSLGLKVGPPKIVKLNTFGASQPSDMYTRKTIFGIKQKDGSTKMVQAKVCKTITGMMTKQKIDVEKYKYLWKDLEMADDMLNQGGKFKLDILIGNDYYDDIVKSEKIKVDDGLYLINSTLGWMFSGRLNGHNEEEDEVHMSMLVDDEFGGIDKFWELETIGIQNTTKEMENEELLTKFRNTLLKKGNRYQVVWPWKLSKYELPNNYKLAEARLKSLADTLNKDKELMVKYDEIIRKQMRDGIIEEADRTKEYLQKDSVVTHYLPHHMVKSKDSATNKLRIVYEGCAKTHHSKRSLNECLYRGENMVSNLCGVLLRFRLNRIAMIADIEKAYLQLELNPSERDVTRFLWLKDINQPFSNENIQEFRFCRVIWGIICSSFLLASTIYLHLLSYDNPVSRDIMINLYVDNLVSGAESVEKAITYYEEAKKIFNDASMNMCKWVSNNEEVMKYVKKEDKCSDKKLKVLGMLWDIVDDKLHLVDVMENMVKGKISKRTMLQIMASVYDPMGIISPVMLAFKLLIQELWKKQINWDDDIPEDIKFRWNKIVKDVFKLHTIPIERCIRPVNNHKENKYELITFTDASKDAYAAVVYLRISDGDYSTVNLLFSKCRLAPIKVMSIPRLELLGVLIGCRASNFITNQLKIKDLNQTILTDSKCVIEWYRSKRELKRFVLDKVKEIRSYDVELGYVKSEDNPADIASRGERIDNLANNKMWWKGPEWMSMNNSPLQPQTYVVDEEIRNAVINEEKGSKILHETGLVADEDPKHVTPFEINEEKFSSHHKLIRVTAWCIRFVDNLRKQQRKGCLSDEELTMSKNTWTKNIQERHFPEVYKAIDKKDHNSVKYNLGVRKDEDGILKCYGRFQMRQTSPKLLPKKSHYTNLIIKRDHRRMLHAGVAQTLSETRNEHWIIQGRAAVQKMIRQCLICIFWEGGPFRTPPFAPLPNYMVSGNNHPFTFVGIDYLGPLLIKIEDSLTKNWICLFTCINIRAIHLELVANMTTESFLMCLRRFIARRGKPTMIISDNANQFKLGNTVIDKIWNNVINHLDVQSYIASEGVKWKFVIEYAPWKGGFYERLIGITKRSLKKSLGKGKVNNQQLLTLLVETEAVINSRPLVYLENDINSRALTPAHFLTLNYELGVPDVTIDYCPEETPSNKLLEMWKKGQAHLNQFWNVWSTEYLQSLRDRHRLQMKPIKGEVQREPKVGEVVIIKEEGLPRGSWKMAKIQSLIISEIDGIPRAANLLSSTGRNFKRPFRLLYPLECTDEERNLNVENENSSREKQLVDNEINDGTKEKPRRKAAVIAREKIRSNAIASVNGECR